MSKVNENLYLKRYIIMKGDDDDSIDESTVDDDHATIGVCGKRKRKLSASVYPVKFIIFSLS